jgi:hypothetical protein
MFADDKRTALMVASMKGNFGVGEAEGYSLLEV